MMPSVRIVTMLLLALAVSISAPGCSLSSSDTVKASPSTSSSAEATTEATGQPPAALPPPPPPAGIDWEVVGTSVQGQPLRVLTVGHGPRKVLFIGGIHGDEAEGSVAAAKLPEAFLAAGLSDAVTLTILEDANPDGRAAGTRGNANGVDVNRNFPGIEFQFD